MLPLTYMGVLSVSHILENIGQCDITLRRLIPKKTITPVFKISTYIISSMTARPIGLAVILAIMSVSTLKAAVIPYLFFHLRVLFIVVLYNYILDKFIMLRTYKTCLQKT